DTHALGVPETVAAYLVKGPSVALVDCGYASSYENVLRGLEEAGVAASEVRYLIPTHVHLDHAGAAGRLLREMPNAEVVAHERGVPHLVDPARLIESASRVFGAATMELYGTPEPIPAERVTAVGEEARLELGGGLGATLIHSPGHAPHQVSVLLEAEGLLITADAVGIVYPGLRTLIPTTPPPSLDPGRLIASAGALRLRRPSKLLTPHFGVRGDVDWVFDKTVEKVAAWVGRVRSMKAKGLSLDEASEAMEAEVREEAGVQELEVYARVSVRSSVMGILHYLEKNP
ncbi:MAG: MBL fold metallo-hydrolase, partial [Thaumarchaeota archaeon]|nr:MBL fold metallo-hydrolase [Nitrososphaerota archaeon]